jgi:hypothetical protein
MGGGMNKYIKRWGALALIILSTASVAGLLVSLNAERRKRIKCQSFLITADERSALDDFDTALSQLKEAREYCDDRDVDLRTQEANIFKVAVEYDQVKLVKNPAVLKEIEVNVQRLGNELGDTPRVVALRGILQELSDEPKSALDTFDWGGKGASNANILNYWGYTIFKWELDGASWPESALAKFELAAKVKPDYPWPYINSAAVYLAQADDALSGDESGSKRPNPDAANAYLSSAKGKLETARKLLPANARVNLLLGTYNRLLGRVLRASNFPEWRTNFYEARDYYIKARKTDPSAADASYLLATVYEELGPDHKADALTEYRTAVKSDAPPIEAVMNLAYYLHLSGENGDAAKELGRAALLLKNLQGDFDSRFRNTADMSAKQWLSKRIAYYKKMEQDRQAMEKEVRGAAKSKKPR